MRIQRIRLRRLGTAVVTIGMIAALAAPANAAILSATPATIAGATIAATPPDGAAPPGVSPEVYYDEATATYYLITTAMPPTEYASKDGKTWTAVTNARLPMGFDWSIVKMGPNDYRLYFAEAVPGQGTGPAPPCTPGSKRLRYATSSDLVTWTTQPTVLLDDLGCGVPHVMKTSAGGYFLYFNKRSAKHGVHIGTSGDGLNWSIRDGIIADDEELVDPAPIQMPDGSFLMIGSTTGNPSQGGLQELQILSSSDALNWTPRTTSLYAPAGHSVLDPSVEIVDGQVRVWFGYADGGDHNTSRITSGVVTLGTAKATAGSTCNKAGATAKANGKKLVCKKTKGTLVWVRVR